MVFSNFGLFDVLFFNLVLNFVLLYGLFELLFLFLVGEIYEEVNCYVYKGRLNNE